MSLVSSRPLLYAAIGLSLAVSGASAAAQPAHDAPAFVQAVSENDNYVFSGDRHYTNGWRAAYGFAKGGHPDWLAWWGRLTPLDDRPADRDYNLALAQHMFTPERFFVEAPQPEDRPFAGWLHGDLTVTTHGPGVEESLVLSLGVVGPWALAAEAQDFAHALSGAREPEGWSNQLRNEPALLLSYRRSLFQRLARWDGVELDIVPRAGASVGTVAVEGGLGTLFRLGSFLPERDVPFRMMTSLAGNSSRFDHRGRFDWMIFIGAQGRAVGHDIFLDGNLFRDSQSVDRKPFVWEGELGVALTLGNFPWPMQMAFTHVWRGREFRGQVGQNRLGAITVTAAF